MALTCGAGEGGTRRSPGRCQFGINPGSALVAAPGDGPPAAQPRLPADPEERAQGQCQSCRDMWDTRGGGDGKTGPCASAGAVTALCPTFCNTSAASVPTRALWVRRW